uniref:Uncharacterized protein n=1 Tax=Ciona savignyi TaxID=51511 RepID=H2ZHG7_CIOSA
MKVMNENADRLNYLAESPTVEGKWASFMSKDGRPSSAAKNSFSAFSPARGDGGKFQILDDDDTDITSYDIPAMEFRGSLKTPEYNPGPSCFCIAFRYIAIVLLCFTVGIAVGYLAGYHQMVCYQVTEKPPVVTSIRNILDNTTSATKIQKETLTTTIGLPGGNNFL